MTRTERPSFSEYLRLHTIDITQLSLRAPRDAHAIVGPALRAGLAAGVRAVVRLHQIKMELIISPTLS